MSIFSKNNDNERRKPGASFPFIERVGNEKLVLRYDAIRFETQSGLLTLVFLQDDVDVYAWTFDRWNVGDMVTFNRLNGTVELLLER